MVFIMLVSLVIIFSLPQNLNDQQQLSTGLGIDMAQFFVKHFMQQSTKCLQKSSYLPSASNTFSASNHLSADTTKTGCYIKEVCKQSNFHTKKE